MRFSYDSEYDILTVYLIEIVGRPYPEYMRTEKISDDVFASFGVDKAPLYFKILEASKKYPQEELRKWK
jgi:hypothetical protein